MNAITPSLWAAVTLGSRHSGQPSLWAAVTLGSRHSGQPAQLRPHFFACFYLIGCGLCFLANYFALNHFEARQLQSLKQSVYFYTRSDIKSTEQAEWLSSHVGMRTLDLSSPNAGAEVYRLTGAHSAASPSLIIPVYGGVQLFSTPFAVQQALQPVLDATTPVHLGKLALVVMAALLLSAYVFRSELIFLLPLLPAVGLVAVASLWGRCVHCGFTSTPLSVYAPLAELTYLAAGMALFTYGSIRNRWCYTGFMVVSGLIPTIQSYMLTGDPKLCPACLAVTFVSAVYFLCSLEALTTSKLPGFTVPSWVRTAMTAVLICLFLRHSLVFGGYVHAGEPPESAVSNVVGISLSQMVPTLGKPLPGMLYVVTEAQCGSCDMAKKQLPAMHVVWHELPVCTILTKEDCFDGGKLSFATPMLLICDRTGQVIFQQDGWVTSQRELSGLHDQIQSAVSRGTEK